MRGCEKSWLEKNAHLEKMTREEQYRFSDFGEGKAGGNKDKGLVTVQSGFHPFLLDNPNCGETEK